ncbi:TetR/AcrR family transcriptional regulator C-terminal domain-containing protein [Mycolicibacterium neoaurum]|uniref:TetR/AcrR family transcriptional regulator n=1 Tax=Mycolicibacterium neoaurum TaxID=1795 RepID=UPI00248BF1FE|nr:TetR/AcrR family transcriptional regulator C-terminal domain-containing protein [Mycolicibacterium neoaurum]WBP97005.1 TetR/AcrR family transcriptional regulator C-terminal domain-containing protein [Mycolicibacterium neoaurum]WBS10715.1 TetR/AcrR family transcriptional regulator C-terminal domain-containing protein [Mycolicibacterium neoaurum]
MARPRILSRERIRDSALGIIDRDGLEGLSMRNLAADLGVQAASLYKHYPTKTEVLDEIASMVVSVVDTSAFDADEPWNLALAEWARSYRSALAAHPNLVPFLALGLRHRDESLRIANAVHGGLVRAGWPAREATMIGAATRSLVLGSTIGSFSRGFADDAQVYRDRYPHMQQAHRLPAKADEIDQGSFDLALTSFIDGLQARYANVDRAAGA